MLRPESNRSTERLTELQAEYKTLSNEIKIHQQKINEDKAKLAKVAAEIQQLQNEQGETNVRKTIHDFRENIQEEWIDKQFPWSNRIKELLTEKFKFEEFKPKQLAAINFTLSNKDLLLVMPTGGGKSLVYQLPALYNEGFTLVIEPLVSLIEDQLLALKKRFGIHAAAIHGSAPKSEITSIQKAMQDKNSGLKVVFVTPEYLAKSKKFMHSLTKAHEIGLVARFVIDEVHCCSTWGHDFRPDYKYLGLVKPLLSNVPFLGLTATASTAVLKDVQELLGMDGCQIITDTINRPNLYYRVSDKPIKKEEAIEKLAELLKKKYKDQNGIIYVTTVADSFNLAEELKKYDVKVAPYNAQMEMNDKSKVHDRWLSNRLQAVVATVAFGMGIDKPDVRFVIHFNMPKSIEGLYQEGGRAGRDGLEADCVVLYSLNDYLKIQGMVTSTEEEKKAVSVLQYCLNVQGCRREQLGAHFEETLDKRDCKGMCDNCNYLSQGKSTDILASCRALHSLIAHATSQGEKLTLNKLMDAWYQTGNKKLRLTNVAMPKFPRQRAEKVIGHLLLNKYLTIDKGYNSYSTICYLQIGKNVPRDVPPHMVFLLPEQPREASRRDVPSVITLESESDEDSDEDGPDTKKMKSSHS